MSLLLNVSWWWAIVLVVLCTVHLIRQSLGSPKRMPQGWPAWKRESLVVALLAVDGLIVGPLFVLLLWLYPHLP